MAQPVKPPPTTWDDLLGVAEGCIGEIVAGELRVTPRPNAPHARATSDLGVLLGGPFRFGRGGPGGWVIIDEPRVQFGADVRVPDLAGWRRDRYAQPEMGPYTSVPDWICEVLSKRTVNTDRGEKMPLYARHGVSHLWLLDPLAQLLEIYRLHEGKWLLLGVHQAAEKIRAEPFDAVELALADVWGPPREDDPTGE